MPLTSFLSKHDELQRWKVKVGEEKMIFNINSVNLEGPGNGFRFRKSFK